MKETPKVERDENLKEFLKTYIEILREGIDITDQLPLHMDVLMPKGCIEISTKRNTVFAIVFDDGLGPAAPIGPIAMTFAKLFVELTNAYEPLYLQGKELAKREKESNNGIDQGTT